MSILNRVEDNLRHFIAALMESQALPGMAVALTDRESTLHISTYGYANSAARTPIRPDTLFQTGSIGKSFTGIALLQEYEAGRLDLHAPITEYLPWFEVPSPYPPITIHHLLTHTAGITSGSDFSPDSRTQVWALRESAAAWAPGERFLYSNDGYKALGLVLDSLRGQPYAATTREQILGPLGMDHTAPAITNDKGRKLSVKRSTRSLASIAILGLVLAVSAIPTDTHANKVRSRQAARISGSCSTAPAFLLVPEPLKGPFARNGPVARDIPRGVLSLHFPVYPGIVRSTVTIPQFGDFDLPPAYRKVATAEFAVAVGYAAVSAWYRATMPSCGLLLGADTPLQRHGGPAYAELSYASPDGLMLVHLTFRPLTERLTAVRYVVEALDLPPRPPASFLRGPFVRVGVDFQSFSSAPSFVHRYSFTITWPATTSRLVVAVNRLKRVYVPGLGMGGGGVIASSVTTLSFVREDGGIRRVRIGTLRGMAVVGHSRPLDAYSGNLFDVVRRIVAHRCSTASACA